MRNANRTASNPPARATISHSSGAASPNTEKPVVNSTGSGFQDEPDVVSSEKCSTSRPHTIHDHESWVGTDGSSSDSAASTKQPSTSSANKGTRRRRPAAVDEAEAAALAAGGSAISVTARVTTKTGGGEDIGGDGGRPPPHHA